MKSFKGLNKPVLLFDFESTGFVKNSAGDVDNPGDPTQLGAVLLNAKTLIEEDSFISDIRVDPRKLDPWVLKHTDITPERVAEAPDLMTVAENFLTKFGIDVYLASWNVVFDRTWLDAVMRSIDRRDSMYDYHHIDVWSLAYAYLCRYGYTDIIRSEAVFQRFGQSTRLVHNALDDCRRTAEVLRTVLFDTGLAK